MLKQKVMLMALILVVGLSGYVRAELINVPGGEFNMYKPGTGYTVVATFPDGGAFDNYAQGVGDNVPVGGDGIANYGDGTSGSTVDIPGWVGIVGTTDIGRDGVDGTTAFSAFGTWSGGSGTSAGSADSLGQIAGGATYMVSAMVNGPAEPLLLELHAGGVAMTPSSSVTPASPTDGWQVISRTYDAAAIAAYAGEPITIIIGTFAEDGVYTGTRVAFDNITLEVEGLMQPSPAHGETVMVDENLELSWTNLPPADANDVWVDVWFGTEPNVLSPDYDMTLVVDAGENTDAVIVDASEVDTYYWQVNSYLNGADNINDSNMVEGTLWLFYAVSDVAPTVEIVTLDQMTWSGEGVPLETTVTDDGVSPLTYLWTADPAHGVAFDSDSIANPIVTFTNRILIREIQATNDDAEEHVNTQAISGAVPQGTMVLDSSDLELGSEGNGGLDWQVIAVQYNQLGIPQGSTITSAKLTFQVDNSGAAGTSNDFTILAEAADDAAVFEEVLNNITDRARSAASVAWAPDWGTGPVVGTKVDTPDITTLIQEVVDRAGWSDNNRLTLMIYPDVYLASPTGGTTTVQEIEFEANPGSDSATLTVTYDPPAGSTPLSVPSTYTITVAVSDEANPTPDTASIVIDVYDDACQMAKFGQGRSAITDFNGNCISNLEDFAVIAAAWLDDYAATGAVDRP